MSLNLREVFTPPTFLAIRDIYEERNWQDINAGWVEPKVAAEMFFRLRVAADSLFPRGKWATIQQLESALDSHYRNEEKAV